MRWRRDPHLGDLAAALADGEPTLAERDRALAHLARCPACRAEVATQRSVKHRLGALADPVPPARLTERLLDLPDTGRRRRRRRRSRRAPYPGAMRPAATRSRAGAGPRTPSVPPGQPAGRRHRRSTHVLTGLACATAGLCGLAYAVGGDTGGGAPVTPAVTSYVQEHVATVGRMPVIDPGMEPAVSVVLTARGGGR